MLSAFQRSPATELRDTQGYEMGLLYTGGNPPPEVISILKDAFEDAAPEGGSQQGSRAIPKCIAPLAAQYLPNTSLNKQRLASVVHNYSPTTPSFICRGND
jgi:hypothetical protein